MNNILFVNEVSSALQLQYCRSHTALVTHRRRRESLRRGATGENQWAQWPISRPDSLESSASAETKGDDADSSISWRGTTCLTIIEQPALPLMLAPDAAPAASVQGHKYVSWYINNAISKFTLVYPAFNISSIHTIDWVPIITNRLVFHAAAAYLQAALDGESGPSKAMLVHRGEALGELRSHLARSVGTKEEVGPNVVMAVTMLGLLEERLGNQECFKMHRATMGRMMRAKGGLETLRYEAGYSLACEAEMCWALDTGYSVINYQTKRRCRRNKRSKNVREMERWHLEALPIGWKALVQEGALSSDLVWTLVHITEGLKGKGHGKGTEKQDVELRKFDYYWDAFPYLHVSHKKDLGLEELLEMAILQFCSHTIAPRYPGATTHAVSRRMLIKHLPVYAAKRQTSMSEAEANVVLWMWLLTLYAWESPTNEPSAKDATWFEELPGIDSVMRDEDDLGEILRGFFWTQDFLSFGRRRWSTLLRDCGYTTRGNVT